MEDKQTKFEQVRHLIPKVVKKAISRFPSLYSLEEDLLSQMYIKSNVILNSHDENKSPLFPFFVKYLTLSCREWLKIEHTKVRRNKQYFDVYSYDPRKEERLDSDKDNHLLLMNNAIERLPFSLKEIIIKNLKRGWTLEEIAKEYSIEMSVVVKMHKDALERLKNEIRQHSDKL